MSDVALCQCGRPLKHRGRCKGFKQPRPAKKDRFLAHIETERLAGIALCNRLKADIRKLQAELVAAETRLAALEPLKAAYTGGSVVPSPRGVFRIGEPR